jgi:transcription elongation factor Elf1
MITTVYFECPKCQAEHSVEYDLGEHFGDLPDNCEECDHKFTAKEQSTIYEALDIQALERLADRADMYNDLIYDR